MRATASDRSAAQVLAWGQSLFVPALRDAVDSLPASMRLIAGYHLGWWDAHGAPLDSPGGKAIRPTLALLSAAAVGGAPEDAVGAAVAVELVHNFSLLHDDVIDRDDTRRHRLTAWRVFGAGNAILAGDALLTLALETVAVTGRSPMAGELTRTLCRAVQALTEGQNADIDFETRADVDLSECLRMAEHKTGALLSCACALGGLAGGGGPAQVDHLAQFGADLGLAFQVVDDLAGLWGDPRVTGKPAHSDLRNRKKSLPIVAALTSRTPAGGELAAWFAQANEATEADLARAAALVDESGGWEWSRGQVDALHARALDELQSVGPTNQASAELAVLALMVAAGCTR